MPACQPSHLVIQLSLSLNSSSVFLLLLAICYGLCLSDVCSVASMIILLGTGTVSLLYGKLTIGGNRGIRMQQQ